MIGCVRDFVISHIRLDSLLEFCATKSKRVKKLLILFFEKGMDCWWRCGCAKLSKNWFKAIWDKK
jgi:hypothetical protein